MKENIILNKSFKFAVRIVNLTKHLQKDKKEFILSNQILRSGTAIGALVREAQHGESKADFTHKINIALKEANETLYWIDLLHQTNYRDPKSYQSIHQESNDLVKILVSIVKSSKR